MKLQFVYRSILVISKGEMIMKCDVCNSSSTYVKNHEHTYIIKGKEIKFNSDRRFCENCNSLVYDDFLDNLASEKAIELYNQLYGVTKEKIVELRKKYNLSLEQFSKIIGCAKKTLISYEHGKSIPNDSYMTLIKSLIEKPDTINIFLNANKNQFTEKEFNIIESKLSKIDFKSIDSLDEYNGYTQYSKEKIFNIILFFAHEGILKTKLLKEMFYTDFVNFKNTCKSITGLGYYKYTYGPVPDNFENILNECINNNILDVSIKYNNNYESIVYTSKIEFNSSLFSSEELDIMNKIKEKFINFGSKDIADYSHKEKAYLENNLSDKISYDYAFDIEI